jgi:hypothetical protein
LPSAEKGAIVTVSFPALLISGDPQIFVHRLVISRLNTGICISDSATPPSAGALCTMSTDSHSQGNCSLNGIKGTVATLWAGSSNDASVSGSLEITFTSATMTYGTAHPRDVYYFFDAKLVATVKGLSAGATDVTITGRFQNDGIPTGS